MSLQFVEQCIIMQTYKFIYKLDNRQLTCVIEFFIINRITIKVNRNCFIIVGYKTILIYHTDLQSLVNFKAQVQI